jgi:hypothetical protein
MTKSSSHDPVVGFGNVRARPPSAVVSSRPAHTFAFSALRRRWCRILHIGIAPRVPTRPETSVSSAASGSAIDRTSMLWLSVISAHQPRCISFSATGPILCSEHSRCPNACNRCDLSFDLPFAQEQPCYPHLRVVPPRWLCWRHRNCLVSGSTIQDLLTADRPCASSAHTRRDRRRRCSPELWFLTHAGLCPSARVFNSQACCLDRAPIRPSEARALRPAQCGLVRDLWHPAISAPSLCDTASGSRPCCHPLFLSILTSTLATSGSPRLVELATLHACFTPRADFDLTSRPE